MKRAIILNLIIILVNVQVYSQTFSQYHFKYSGNCPLESSWSTTSDNGDDVKIFQCVQNSTKSILQIRVVNFKADITDINSYYKDLKSDYSKQGTVSLPIHLKGKRQFKK